MTKIEKIKSDTIKDYLGPGVIGGFLFGLIIFLLCLIGEPWDKAISLGIFFWIIIFSIHFLAFLYIEWWQRKKKINTLRSDRYIELISEKYNLTNDLYYEKEIRNFHTEIYSENNDVINHYIKIYCICEIESFEQIADEIKKLNDIESLYREYGFITIKIAALENSLYNLTDNILKKLEKYNAKPLSKFDWQQTFEKEIKKCEKEELKNRTKTLKLGKLKIDIIKSK